MGFSSSTHSWMGSQQERRRPERIGAPNVSATRTAHLGSCYTANRKTSIPKCRAGNATIGGKISFACPLPRSKNGSSLGIASGHAFTKPDEPQPWAYARQAEPIVDWMPSSVIPHLHSTVGAATAVAKTHTCKGKRPDSRTRRLRASVKPDGSGFTLEVMRGC